MYKNNVLHIQGASTYFVYLHCKYVVQLCILTFHVLLIPIRIKNIVHYDVSCVQVILAEDYGIYNNKL